MRRKVNVPTKDVIWLQHSLSAHVAAHSLAPSFYFLPGVGGVFQAHAAPFLLSIKKPRLGQGLLFFMMREWLEHSQKLSKALCQT